MSCRAVTAGAAWDKPISMATNVIVLSANMVREVENVEVLLKLCIGVVLSGSVQSMKEI